MLVFETRFGDLAAIGWKWKTVVTRDQGLSRRKSVLTRMGCGFKHRVVNGVGHDTGSSLQRKHNEGLEGRLSDGLLHG